MFIYCIDNKLKEGLLKKGFKLLKEDDHGSIFALDSSLKFNFDKVDKSKFLFTNKLTF